jgi:uncharacterized membrane protein
MAAHNFNRDRLAGTRRLVDVVFKINTGVAGAVSSFSSKKEGISNVTLAATGRYTCTLDAKYTEVLQVVATIFIAGAAAYTAAKARTFIVRDATTSTFILQGLYDGNADAVVQDSAVIKVIATMRDS